MKIPEEAEVVFEGKIFTLYQWKQGLYDGSFATFEMAKRKGTAMVFPILENGNIVLTVQEQPRKGKYVDFVGGGQEKGHTLLETAHKELLEETGYKAKKLELILEEDLGGSKMCYENEYYIASGLEKIAEQDLDAGEKIELLEVTQEDFFSMIFPTKAPPHFDLKRVINKLREDDKVMKIFNSLKK